MFIRPLKAGPDIRMAFGALLVDLRRLTRHQTMRSVLVDRVAGCAAYLVLVMAAGQTTDVSGLVLMAGETDTVGFGGL